MENEAVRTVVLTLPEELLTETEHRARGDNITQNELIVRAIKDYLRERRRGELKKKAEEGYRSMGEINLSIARQCLKSDESAFKIYEEFLSESDDGDSKTR